jgi:nucleotide-binding universal stress UspA family protein
MLKFLVPLDGSPPSLAALFEAAQMATQHPAELVLLHVVQEVFQGADLVAPYNDELQKKGLTVLEEARAALEQAGFSARTRLVKGDPGDAVLAAVQEESPDLIAMGTHARTGLSRFFLGSLTEHVLSHTPCPILVTRRERTSLDPAAARDWAGIRRVVVGMDGSEEARRAASLLPTFMPEGGEVTLVSAVDLPYSGDAVVEMARQSLTESPLSALATHPGLDVRLRVEMGSAARLLVAVAEETRADLIVVGTQGRGGWLLGSVTREVVRCAGCPVLAVHGQSRLWQKPQP